MEALVFIGSFGALPTTVCLGWHKHTHTVHHLPSPSILNISSESIFFGKAIVFLVMALQCLKMAFTIMFQVKKAELSWKLWRNAIKFSSHGKCVLPAYWAPDKTPWWFGLENSYFFLNLKSLEVKSKLMLCGAICWHLFFPEKTATKVAADLLS